MGQDDEQAGADRKRQQTHKRILETDTVEIECETLADDGANRLMRINERLEGSCAVDLWWRNRLSRRPEFSVCRSIHASNEES